MFSASILIPALALLRSATANPFPEYRSTSEFSRRDDSCTNTTYTVLENDTMPAIAASYNQSVCSIARASRLADPQSVYAGEILIIPGGSCASDNTTDTSCYPTNNTAATYTCVLGGPHVYTTYAGDTLQSIAEEKFNISLAALQVTQAANYPDPYAVIETGAAVKIPLCETSQCVIQPLILQYGTVAELAYAHGTTVGQILALNPGYRNSDASTGPTLTTPSNCTAQCDPATDCTSLN